MKIGLIYRGLGELIGGILREPLDKQLWVLDEIVTKLDEIATGLKKEMERIAIQ